MASALSNYFSKYQYVVLTKKILKKVKANLLIILTIFFAFVGIGLGFLIRNVSNFNPTQKSYFAFPGEIFLRIIKLLILPLIVTSLIQSIGEIQNRNTGKIAIKCVLFYVTTAISAIIMALLFTNIITPGTRSRGTANFSTTSDLSLDSNTQLPDQETIIINTILDLIRNAFPDNLIKISFSIYKTKYLPHFVNNTIQNTSKLDYWQTASDSKDGLNIVGVALCSIVFGLVLSKLKSKAKSFYEIIEILNEVSIILITKIMWYSPIGNCFLICSIIISVDNIESLFYAIPFYVLTLIVSLLSQIIIVGLLYLIFTRHNPLTYAKNSIEALVLAFVTSSSAASLSVSLKCTEDKNKIPKLISRFMLTIGTSINVDGTTLYSLIAAIFIAQLENVELKAINLFVISVIAAFASIGAAGIPAGATLALIAILNALNIPNNKIAVFISLDWLMDRFFTVHNVWGGCVGAGVINHFSQKELRECAKDMEKNGDSEFDTLDEISNESDVKKNSNSKTEEGESLKTVASTITLLDNFSIKL